MPNIQEYIDQNYPENTRANINKLDLNNQNLEGTLTPKIAEFFNLEELSLSNNRLAGSLEPLKNMTKLRKLDISGTDIDEGLECLPSSLKEIHCLSGKRPQAKVKAIAEVAVSLFEAVHENKIEEIIKIIKAKKLNNLNFYDEHGNTLLHYATQKDNLSLLKLLVRNGGDVNATNNDDWTVLHHAALWIVKDRGDWNIIEFLLENGADADAETESGLTARDIFFQKDYSYIEQYDNLVDRVAQQMQILIKTNLSK